MGSHLAPSSCEEVCGNAEEDQGKRLQIRIDRGSMIGDRKAKVHAVHLS